MSINLYVKPDGPMNEHFENSDMNLKDKANFKKAVVTSGTWIFYTHENYNDAQLGGSANNYKVLCPGNEEDISKVNGSMYLMPDQTEGFILFAHCYYGGFRKYYKESCPDVNKLFPSGHLGGVSSALVLSQNEKFEIFSEINYAGLTGLLKEGKWCPTPGDMGFSNDRLQSVRKE